MILVRWIQPSLTSRSSRMAPPYLVRDLHLTIYHHKALLSNPTNKSPLIQRSTHTQESEATIHTSWCTPMEAQQRLLWKALHLQLPSPTSRSAMVRGAGSQVLISSWTLVTALLGLHKGCKYKSAIMVGLCSTFQRASRRMVCSILMIQLNYTKNNRSQSELVLTVMFCSLHQL